MSARVIMSQHMHILPHHHVIGASEAVLQCGINMQTPALATTLTRLRARTQHRAHLSARTRTVLTAIRCVEFQRLLAVRRCHYDIRNHVGTR